MQISGFCSQIFWFSKLAVRPKNLHVTDISRSVDCLLGNAVNFRKWRSCVSRWLLGTAVDPVVPALLGTTAHLLTCTARPSCVCMRGNVELPMLCARRPLRVLHSRLHSANASRVSPCTGGLGLAMGSHRQTRKWGYVLCKMFDSFFPRVWKATVVSNPPEVRNGRGKVVPQISGEVWPRRRREDALLASRTGGRHISVQTFSGCLDFPLVPTPAFRAHWLSLLIPSIPM